MTNYNRARTTIAAVAAHAEGILRVGVAIRHAIAGDNGGGIECWITAQVTRRLLDVYALLGLA